MNEIAKIRFAVKNEAIARIYLWYGEDRFLLQEGLKVLQEYYQAIDPSGSNVEKLSARQTPVAEIVARANSCSFFPNLIVVDDVTYFQEGQAGNDFGPLLEYFHAPNPHTCLVFLAETIHKGRKLYKEFTKGAEILEFAAPKRQAEWQSWVQSEVKMRGKTMKAGVCAFFLEWVGHQPGVVSQELDKLSLYMGGQKEIREEDIRAVATRAIEANVFNLLDAVAARSSAQAMQLLKDVLREEHPLKVLTLLTRQIRLLLGAQAARKQGMGQNDLPSALGIKPYEAQKIWQQSTRFSQDVLTRSMEECLLTERAIKTGKGEGGFLLELLVAKFCQFNQGFHNYVLTGNRY